MVEAAHLKFHDAVAEGMMLGSRRFEVRVEVHKLRILLDAVSPTIPEGSCLLLSAVSSHWFPEHRLPRHLKTVIKVGGRWNSSVGMALGYGLNDRRIRVRFLEGTKRFFFSPQIQNLLWGPPSLLPNGDRGYIPGSKVAGA